MDLAQRFADYHDKGEMGWAKWNTNEGSARIYLKSERKLELVLTSSRIRERSAVVATAVDKFAR